MTVSFECPETGIVDQYENAYKGLKFKCKHCLKFHVLPDESAGPKQILANCPNTGILVAIEKTNTAHLFKCASCQETHDVPDIENTGSRVVLRSTLQVTESRQTIIPSQRKISPLQPTKGSSRKAIIPSKNSLKRKSSVHKSPSKKERNEKEENDDENNDDENDYAPEEHYRAPRRPSKRKSSATNTFIYLLFLTAILGIGYLVYVNQNSIADESTLRKKIGLANKAYKNSEFENAVNLIFEVLATLESNIELQSKIDTNKVNQQKDLYIKQRDFVKGITEKYTPIINDKLLDERNVKEHIKKLLTEIRKLEGPSEQKGPVIYAISRIQDKLIKKITEIKYNVVDNQLKEAKQMHPNDFHRSLELYNETMEYITNFPPDSRNKLNLTHKAEIAFFKQKEDLYNNLEATFQSAVGSKLLITEALKELNNKNNALQKNLDQSLKNIISRFILKLKQRQNVYEVRDIGTFPNKSKEEKRKELLTFFATLKSDNYLAKKEVFTQLSNLTLIKLSKDPFLEIAIDDLKLLAKAIGNHLKNGSKLKGEVHQNEYFINFIRDQQTFKIGLINFKKQPHLSIQLNDTQIIYPKDLFFNNIIFHIEHFTSLYNELILLDSKNRSQTLWRVPAEFLNVGLIAAIQVNQDKKALLINGKIYQLETYHLPFESLEKTKTNLATLKEQIRIKILKSKESFSNKTTLIKQTNIAATYTTDNKTKNKQQFLLNSSHLTSSLNDATLVAELKTFQKGIRNLLNKESLWFKGKGAIENTIEATITNQQNYHIRIFNPKTIFTSFIYQSTDQNQLFAQKSKLYFIAKYKGRQSAMPKEDPYTITTKHPASGNLAVYDFFSKEIHFSEEKWQNGIDILNLISNQSNKSAINLPPHALQIKSNLKVLFTKNSSLNLKDYQKKPNETLEAWFKQNISKNNLPSLINVFVMYFNTHQIQDTINEGFIINETKIKSENIIHFQIKLLLNKLGLLNTLIYHNHVALNLWKQKQNKKIHYFNGTKALSIASKDHLKSLRKILQKRFQDYISPFKLPSLMYHKKSKSWLPCLIPGYLLSQKIKRISSLKILKEYNRFSATQIVEEIEQSEIKNSNIRDLLSYVGFFQNNLNNKAQELLRDGLTKTKNIKTVIGQLEIFDLQKFDKNNKPLLDSAKKIFKALVTSNSLKGNSLNIQDIRFYLANELINQNQLAMVLEIIGPELSKNNLSLLELNTLSNICDRSFHHFENKNISNEDFSKGILPIQSLINKEVQIKLKTSKSNNDLLLINHIWFKVKLSQQGWDKSLSQILTPINSNGVDITNIQNEHQQIELSKINPLNFKHLIRYTLRQSAVQLKNSQKIQLIKKYIQSFENNSKAVQPKKPQAPFYKALILIKDFDQLSNQEIIKKTKSLLPLLLTDKILIKAIGLHFNSLDKDKFSSLIREMLKHKTPKSFFFKLQNVLKSSRKTKELKLILNIKN